MRFKEKVCIVTGGASGIGRAVCLRFAAEGASVIIVDMNEEKGKETEALIKANNGRALFIRTDISISAEIQTAVAAALKAWKKVDILVNNAAIMTFKPIVELPEEDWDKLMAVNL